MNTSALVEGHSISGTATLQEMIAIQQLSCHMQEYNRTKMSCCTSSWKISCISHWKVAGALHSLKGMWLYSYNPLGVVKAVL